VSSHRLAETIADMKHQQRPQSPSVHCFFAVLIPCCAVLATALSCKGGFGDYLPGGGGGTGGSGLSTSTSGTGGTSQGGTGGTFSVPREVDSCPGKPLDIYLSGGEVSEPDTTHYSGAYYSSYCGVGDGSGNDTVYQLNPDASGTLRVTLRNLSDGFDGVLYLRSDCDEPATVLTCVDEEGLGGEESLLYGVGAGEADSYFLFVDGSDVTEGDYELGLSLEPALCGDGVVNEPDGEQCDYGDPVPGCDSSCHFEPPDTLEDICSTKTINLTTDPLTQPGHTIGYTDDYAAPCGAAAGGPDRAYTVTTPGFTGSLTVSVEATDFDAVLSVYAVCSNGELDNLLACSDDPEASATEQVTLPADPNSEFIVVVDGYDAGSYGSYTLTLSLGQ